MKERGVHLPRNAGMSAEMKAAASERRTVSVTTGTTTLNISHHGTLVMTGRPEMPVRGGTLAIEEGKQPETLVTTETTGT